jgi:hypothetical protein
MFERTDPAEANPDSGSHDITNRMRVTPSSGLEPVDPTADLAHCFLRLANLSNFALDRLSRYEATLWRQAGQILFALHALDRRKPQDRAHRFRLGRGQERTADESYD